MKPPPTIAEAPEVLLMGGAAPSAALPLGFDDAPAAPAVLAPEVAAASIRSHLRDLYDLTKPRMNFLVVVTTLVGFFMAAPPDWRWALLLNTLLGTALTAAGASVLNQYAEREYDALMPRTRNRPLPAGRLTAGEALAFGVALGLVGVLDLALFVNGLTALLGALTLGSYVLLYTPLKRVTTLCTVVGAVPGAIPPVMGVTAAVGGLTPTALVLFGVLFVWQMPHFLAIAILYRDDYARGGFKMLPVVDNGLTATSLQIVLWSLALVPVSLMPALFGVSGPTYFFAALLMGLAFLGFGLLCAARRSRADARHLFLASILYLPCLLGAMMIDKL